MSFPVIDAHQHVWDPRRAEYAWLDESLAPLNAAIALDQLLPELAQAGVRHTVQVQSADNAQDTALMQESAAQHPDVVVAIVGYGPLERPDQLAATLDAWRTDSRMVGIRTLIHNQEDPDWLLRDDVAEGLAVLEDAGLTLDVVAVLPRHLELVPILADRYPRLRMVIDHLAKPPIGIGERDPWWTLIASAAESPMVTAKVSGLYSATADLGTWSTDAIRPFFDRAVEVFGVDRLMYGGDWPISVLAGGYTRVWGGLAPLFASLDPAEREQLLGRTAAEFYRIDPGRLALDAPDAGEVRR
ncbi:amidohydrolase family protein [Demequina maris]|uniref:amidohydrolase family protein n=1 Tax=Demequina maris TaxID=1638982 RepID=UPI0007833353|nr:amidohydrolase family protein [Demequina maris]